MSMFRSLMFNQGLLGNGPRGIDIRYSAHGPSDSERAKGASRIAAGVGSS